VARILEWIDRVPPEERFFVTYLPIAGHHPYEVPRSADSLALPKSGRATLSGERTRFEEPTEFDRYLNALRYGDAAVGALMAGIRDRGLYDRTAWIVFGDHGEAFGQHEGNYGHTFQVYEENVHVPLIVAVPGRAARRERSDRVVSSIDIAPTLLDIAGIAAPKSYQGTSAIDENRRMAMFFADYSLRLLGLRDGAMKYIIELDSGRSQLFDLGADPGETHDVADRYPDDVHWYAQKLNEWMK
jgi:arylsulfatase A-like enzyme